MKKANRKTLDLTTSDLAMLRLIDTMLAYIKVYGVKERVKHMNIKKGGSEKEACVEAEVIFYVGRFKTTGPTNKMSLTFSIELTEIGWQFVEGSWVSWEILGIKMQTKTNGRQFYEFTGPDLPRFTKISHALQNGDSLTRENTATMRNWVG